MKQTGSGLILIKSCFILSLVIFLAAIVMISSFKKEAPDVESGIRIRPGYTSSYETYIERQLNKTLNPKLRQRWTTRDYGNARSEYSPVSSRISKKRARALCVGARVGQEVEALKRVGVNDSVPRPPLVISGDFHHQPFHDATFDFEFSNVFDHALYPNKFVAEIERTLRPGGVCVLQVALSTRGDKYSANDLFSVKPLLKASGGPRKIKYPWLERTTGDRPGVVQDFIPVGAKFEF